MCLEIMNSMLKKLKLVVGVSCLMALMIFVACGPKFTDPIDPEEQLAIDIELIEEYLQSKNITEYDTLEGGERVYILSEGSGASLEYNDIVSYNYVGRMLNDTIFDTSIAQLAYDQDVISATSEIILAEDEMGEILYDVNGLARFAKLPSFRPGYSPIYTGSLYQPYVATHSQGGWAIQQLALINGFKNGLKYAFENLKIGGNSIVIMPSYLGYGNTTNPAYADFRNKVLIFEMRPVYKR